MKRLGVTYLRTGLSWADSYRPDALAWFDRQMAALAEFDVALTFCFTPEQFRQGRLTRLPRSLMSLRRTASLGPRDQTHHQE
jgi:beta-xylosidase